MVVVWLWWLEAFGEVLLSLLLLLLVLPPPEGSGDVVWLDAIVTSGDEWPDLRPEGGSLDWLGLFGLAEEEDEEEEEDGGANEEDDGCDEDGEEEVTGLPVPDPPEEEVGVVFCG